VHLLDECALADPLLAHLPAIYSPEWRSGHYRRLIPSGYTETLESGRDEIVDPGLHQYYEHLSALTRSPRIWSWARLKEIAAVDAGRYDGLIDRTYYRFGGKIVAASELASPRPEGTPAADPLNHRIDPSLAVVFPGLVRARRIDLTLDSDDKYFLSFFRTGRLQSTLELGPIPDYRRRPGLTRYPMEIPPRAAEGGFDVILISPVGGDGRYAIGQLIVE
jgi:arabinofuranosyltransferase